VGSERTFSAPRFDLVADGASDGMSVRFWSEDVGQLPGDSWTFDFMEARFDVEGVLERRTTLDSFDFAPRRP
jgi:hypothetical protein